MNKPTPIAITHNGFDGAAATAVLLERYPEAALWVSSAGKIAQTLSQVNPKTTRHVYVVGVGADDCPRQDIIAALRPLLASKVAVTWFYLWDHLDWLKDEMKAHRQFELIRKDGVTLPRLVADTLGCRSKRSAELIQSAESPVDSDGKKEFLSALVGAATLRYLKFKDAEAFPEAIRKLADPSRITEADRKEARLAQRFGDQVLLGKSEAMERLRGLIRKVGSDPSCKVLILGETGTGKELVAEMIHEYSPRREAPFIAVSCANFPEHLLESELFGHEKGSFTGAVTQKKGQFEMAHGGTLFLDEVGEIQGPLQARLLRVLQKGTFYRVGGTQEIRVDVRIIAATNRDLFQAVREGEFREDLFYRLNEVSLKMPPLRDRPEDIPFIARDILYRLAKERETDDPRLSERQVRDMQGYSWPGNVRQLENVLTRAFILGEWDFRKLLEEDSLPAGSGDVAEIVPLAEHDRRYVLNVYEKMGRNKSKTARALGIAVNTLKRYFEGRKVS